ELVVQIERQREGHVLGASARAAGLCRDVTLLAVTEARDVVLLDAAELAAERGAGLVPAHATLRFKPSCSISASSLMSRSKSPLSRLSGESSHITAPPGLIPSA